MEITTVADIYDRLYIRIQKQNVEWSLRLGGVSFEMPQTHTHTHTHRQTIKGRNARVIFSIGTDQINPAIAMLFSSW